MTSISRRELVFQIILHLVVLFFYSFHRHDLTIRGWKVAFFINYLAAAALVSYWLLPQYFYRKQYLAFVGYLLLLVAGVIIMEEFVMEKIFFPDTRGTRFPGIYYSLLDVLPIMTILCGFKFAWDAVYKQRQVESLQLAVRESELQFLKSQINPHFLFNNLNNLYAYAMEQSPKTPQIILELSTVLRYMLYDCRAACVPLEKELQHLQHFTELSKLQIEERGQVRFTQKISTTAYQIAPLILLVFVENAFKHSQASQASGIDINISLHVAENGQLNFRCANNFQTRNNQPVAPRGIGLENVKKRLQLLYPELHELQISTFSNTYKVQLILQLQPL